MAHWLLADLVLFVHLAFIVFVVVGGLLALRARWVAVLHLPAAAWGVFVEASGRVCPLTPLENAMRRAAGDAGYSGGFIDQYLTPVIYPAPLSRGVQLVLAGLVLGLNGLVYWRVWRRRASGAAGR